MAANDDFLKDDNNLFAQTLDLDEYQIIHSRNQEIRQLESDIYHISEIYQTLATMVDFQGDQIDTAKTHIDESVINVQEGTAHLAQSAVHNSSLKKTLVKGAVVCGGVTLGGVALIFLSPIAGIVTIGLGATGAISCLGFAFKK